MRRHNNTIQTLKRLLLLLYFVAVIFICFFNFNEAGLHFSATFLGLPTDKVVHFCMLLPFPPLAYMNLTQKIPGRPLKLFWELIIIFLLGLAIGIITETLQGALTSYRSEDFYDIIADSCGALSGTLAVFVYVSFCHKARPKMA